MSDLSGEAFALLEMSAVFALVLGFCVWQLVSVRRDRRRMRDRDRTSDRPEDRS